MLISMVLNWLFTVLSKFGCWAAGLLGVLGCWGAMRKLYCIFMHLHRNRASRED